MLTTTASVYCQASFGTEAAIQKYREHPGRCVRARQWPRAHGLAHCGTLLNSRHVLQLINEFGEAPDVLRGVGLPWSCRTTLVGAASSGVVTEKGRRPICSLRI